MKRNHFLQLIIVCLWLFCSFSVFAAPIDSQKAKDWVNDKGRVLLDTFNEPDLQKNTGSWTSFFLNMSIWITSASLWLENTGGKCLRNNRRVIKKYSNAMQ